MNGSVVYYTLDNTEYSIEAGERQFLDRVYVVRFDRGNGGIGEYRLTDGVYQFCRDNDGLWDLVRAAA